VKKTDYYEKNAWGECANDFRTFLDECPDLRFNEVLAAFAQ